MEGESFDPTPAVDEDGKEAEDGKFEMASNEEFVSGEQESGRWLVSMSASEKTPSQESSTWTDKLPVGVQSKIEPIMSHSYVKQSTETATKIYNREEGYEPAKVAPYFAGSVGIVILCILLAGGFSGDSRSKYNVDISGIVADKVKLPDGRHIAYEERGVSKDIAKHNILVAHGFISSRLAGIPGISDRLLEKYAARVVAYDRPGFGQSDPHPKRNYNTSAQDMAYIADALGMGDKFWVLGYSGGGPYAWAALHYIPNRLAGVVMFGPMGNPYAKNMTKEESKSIWKQTDKGRKVLYRLARYFPSFVPAYLKSGIIGKPVKVLRGVKKIVNSKDSALLETDHFGERWERSTRESIRSGDAKPHAEDVILHTNDWGFKLTDLRPKPAKKSLFKRILVFFGGSDLPVFSGPIHIYHGTEDKLVPLAMSLYAKRLLPEQVNLHTLEGHGHFSWFCDCDTCHRELFKTLFGEVEGLDELDKLPAPELAANQEPEVPISVEITTPSEAAPHEEPDVLPFVETITLPEETKAATMKEPEVAKPAETESKVDA